MYGFLCNEKTNPDMSSFSRIDPPVAMETSENNRNDDHIGLLRWLILWLIFG